MIPGKIALPGRKKTATRLVLLLVCLALVGVRSVQAQAGAVIVAWDANTEPDLAGYVLHYGVQPGESLESIDVGNRLSWQLELADGVYYFAVQAYTTAGLLGPLSNDVTVSVGTPGTPNLSDPSNQVHAEGDAVLFTLGATDADGDLLSFTATGLPGGVALDGATGQVSGVLSYSAAAGSPYSVTVTVSDGVLTDEASFTWTVLDTNRAPTLTLLADQQNAEGDVVALAFGANDPDGGVSLDFTATGLPGGLVLDPATAQISGTLDYSAAAGSPFAAVVTASDGTLSASVSFTWIVTETNRAPSLAALGDRSDDEGQAVAVQLAGSDPDDDPLSYSASGLPPDLAIDPDSGLISGALTYSAAGGSPYRVEVTVTDGELSDTRELSWAIGETNAVPTLTASADQFGAEGDAVAVSVAAADPDGDTLSFGAVGLPPGVTLDAGSGLMSGVLAYSASASSPYLVGLTVTDGRLTDRGSFTWTVTDTNRAPVLVAPGDEVIAEGDRIRLAIAATDADGDVLALSTSGLPAGLSLSGAEIVGVVDYAAAASSPYGVVVTATDGVLSASASFVWTVTDTNRAPSLAGLADRSAVEGAAVVLSVSASDPDGDPVSYGATGLPVGVEVEASTGVISGTLDYAAAASSPYGVVVTVIDGVLSASASFVWTVTDTNRAPSLAGLADRSAVEGTAVVLSVSASDPDGDSLSYGATGLPVGVEVEASTGVISGTLDYAAAASSPYGVVVTVIDGVLSASASFVWTVTNTNRAPALSDPGAQTSAEGEPVALTVAVTDPDGDAVTYSATGLPAELSLDASTGEITGTLDFTASAASPYAVTVTASDGDLSDSVSVTWRVANTNRAPVLSDPGAQAGAEGETVILTLAATDPDGDALTYGTTGLPEGLSLDGTTGAITGTLDYAAAAASPYTVVVTVTDGALSDATSVTWTVTDANGAPILAYPGSQLSVEGETALLSMVITDPDGDPLTGTATGLPAGLSFDEAIGQISGTAELGTASVNPYDVTITASDGTTSSSTSFTWTVTEAGTESNLIGSLIDSVVQGGAQPDGDTSAGAEPQPEAEADVPDESSSANEPPVLTPPGDQFDVEGEPVSLALEAVDAEGDPLIFSASGLPPGLQIDAATGLVGGSVTFLAAGGSPHAVTVSVSDGIQAVSLGFLWAIEETNRPPEIEAIADQSDVGGDTLSLDVAAADPDGDTLVYDATGLPAGLTMDPVTGVISGQLASTVGTYLVTVSASDGDLVAERAFFWTVTTIP